MALTTVPVELASLDGAVTVNESSADADFRVESNGSANMLFVDGGNDRLGINTNSPLMRLHVKTAVGDTPSNDSNPPANGIAIFDSGGGYSLVIGTDDSNTGSAWIQSQSANTSSSEYDLLLNPNGGDVGIGVTNPAHALEINRSSSSAAYAVVGNGGNVQSYIGVAGDNLPVLGSLTNHDLRLVVNASEKARLNTDGIFTMPSQPAFSAVVGTATTNVATDGGRNTVGFTNEIFDNNADYNASASTFTAPVAGRYQLNASLYINDSDAEATYIRMEIRTSNRDYTYIFEPNYSADRGRDQYSLSVLADMDASDTALVDIGQYEGTAQMDVPVSAQSNFSGFLAC